jgi:hypothetical protein
MIEKIQEKKQAILLRKQGKTYAEILNSIPVAKSTLSLWLREVGIAKRQIQKLTHKRLAASKRGGQARYQQRIYKYDELFNSAKSFITPISKKELFLIGVVLYWAEGSKEKPYRPGSGIEFINMDPRMIVLFITWLTEICKIQKDMIVFETHLHQTSAHRVEDVKQYWSTITGFPLNCFNIIRFKKHPLIVTKRKNIGDLYFGSLKIRVRQSSSLVRKIAGWTEGIQENIVKNN